MNNEMILHIIVCIGIIGLFILVFRCITKDYIPVEAKVEFELLIGIINDWLRTNNSQNNREVVLRFYKPETMIQPKYPYMEELSLNYKYGATTELLRRYYMRSFEVPPSTENLDGCRCVVVSFGKMKF